MGIYSIITAKLVTKNRGSIEDPRIESVANILKKKSMGDLEKNIFT